MRSKARAEPCCQPGSIIEQGPEVDRGAFVCLRLNRDGGPPRGNSTSGRTRVG